MHEDAMSRLTFCAFLAACASNAIAAPLIIAPVKLDAIGDCAGHGKSYDLRRLMLLSNTSLDIVDKAQRNRVSIEGDRVRIEGLTGGRGTYVVKLPYIIEGGAALDVETKLASLDGEPFVYWKETYQHRIYRQGLFRIAGQRLEPVCQGRGGVTSSH